MKKKVPSRAQSSLEFLMVTGIGLMLLTGVAIVYLNYSKESSDKVRLQQVTLIGSSILEQAARVHSWGANSWLPVEASLPENVVAIYTVENNTLVFDVNTQNGLVSQPVFSTTPITGVRQVGMKIHLNNASIPIHPGPTKFRVTATGTQVILQAMS